MDESSSSERTLAGLVCVLFFLFAMTSDAVGSVIARVIRETHLSLTAAGAFHYAPMLAIAAGGLGLGFLADRVGRQWAILVGLGLYGVSSALFVTGSALSWFVGLLVVSGIGISIFKVGGLALVGDIVNSVTAHTRLMNAVEGSFAIGSIVGPAIVAVLLSEQLSWRGLYVIAAIICLVLILIVSRVRFPAARRGGAAAPAAEILHILKTPGVPMQATLIMLYVAVEVAVYVWMPTYLEAYRGEVRWLPGIALTLFFGLRACGRFFGVWLLGKMRPEGILAVAGALILGGFLTATLGGASWAAWSLPLTGLPMSVIYPTLNSRGISRFPREQQGAAAGVLLFFTAIAAALGPLAMAAVSDVTGDQRYGFGLASFFAALLAAGLAVGWMRPQGALQGSAAT